jgi:hypothetical protein
VINYDDDDDAFTPFNDRDGETQKGDHQTSPDLIIHSFTGAYSPGWTFGLPSAHRRDLYLHRITQHINTTDKHP